MKMFDLINFLINNPCEDPNILNVILFIRKIIEIAFIIVPIVLIILITFDFIKNVTAGTEDVQKKNQKIVIKRLVYAVMLFFVIPIVNIIFSAFGTSGNENLISQEMGETKVNYLSCWDNAKDKNTIESFEITAIFKGNGGKVFGGEKKTCGGSVSCELTMPNASRSGYKLKGWIRDGESTLYKVGEKVKIKNNDLFTAQWELKENGGNSNTANIVNNNLSSSDNTKANDMINFAKSLKGLDMNGVRNKLSNNETSSFGGDWCSWFVWNMYYKFNLINEGTWNASYENTDNLAYASGWMFLKNNAYNGYSSKGYNNDIVGNKNYIPQPGDLVMYLWDGSGNIRASHVGLVTKVEKGKIYTVEGNAYPNYLVEEKEKNISGGISEYIGNVAGGQIVGYYSLAKARNS